MLNFSAWNYAKIGQTLFFLAALFSAVAAVAFFMRPSELQAPIKLTMVALLSVDALILAGLGWLLAKAPARYAGLAAGFAFLSIAAFIFDDIGLVDLVALLFYMALFAVCLKLFLLNRKSQP
ncbi:MAG: hypothetical protein CVU44_03270 [Chloroflexi bacterium HGW-Chloroflexi-6]|nr:MAG: hypothetical protein CVU44_03270 [Chloroflexi bacterium HGW-Chloroflexi-6]